MSNRVLAPESILSPRSPGGCGIRATSAGRRGQMRSSRSAGAPARVVGARDRAFSTVSRIRADWRPAASRGGNPRRVLTVPGMGAFAMTRMR